MQRLAGLALLLCATASAVHLTPDNFDDLTAGKSVFIKFYAPWCGHCKKLAPAWDKLMDEYDGHDTALVAKVDCTAEGRPLCDANGVRGFPTLKYGDPTALDDYQGGRGLAELKKFATGNLKPVCGPSSTAACNEEELAQLQQVQAMDAAALQGEIDAKTTEIEQLDAAFKTETDKLRDEYERLSNERDQAVEQVKKSGLGLMKAVKAAKAKAMATGEL